MITQILYRNVIAVLRMFFLIFLDLPDYTNLADGEALKIGSLVVRKNCLFKGYTKPNFGGVMAFAQGPGVFPLPLSNEVYTSYTCNCKSRPKPCQPYDEFSYLLSREPWVSVFSIRVQCSACAA